MASKEEQVRTVIVCGRNENSDLSVRKLAKKLGFSAITAHNVLKSFDTRLITASKAGSGTKTEQNNVPNFRAYFQALARYEVVQGKNCTEP